MEVRLSTSSPRPGLPAGTGRVEPPAATGLLEPLAPSAAAPPRVNEGGGPRAVNTEDVRRAVERLNRTADALNTSLRFSVHDKTGDIIVRVVDTASGEVIREIPPEKVLDALAQMLELIGLLVDERA